jgi:hypothetical protein
MWNNKGAYQTHWKEIKSIYSSLIENPTNANQRKHNRTLHVQVALIKLRSHVNRNFIIRIRSNDQIVRQNRNLLVSAGQYSKHVGNELALKHFTRVLNHGWDSYTFRLRRGVKCEFLSK